MVVPGLDRTVKTIRTLKRLALLMHWALCAHQLARIALVAVAFFTSPVIAQSLDVPLGQSRGTYVVPVRTNGAITLDFMKWRG
jgi:hypothetical protein